MGILKNRKVTLMFIAFVAAVADHYAGTALLSKVLPMLVGL